MAADKKRRNLGRGLSALLGEEGEGYASLDKLRVSKSVPIEYLNPGRYQPRRNFDEKDIKDLAQSIHEKGILQPILVRRLSANSDKFEIIAGERRWKAAQKAKLHEVPVIIKDISDQEVLEIALVENLQRKDLSALEEAEGYKRLMEEFSHTQENLGKAVGKSRSHVANLMRLLELPETIKKMLNDGELSAGHARTLLNAADPVVLARHVVDRGLNVRQTERLSKKKTGLKKPPKIKKETLFNSTDTLALERDLTNLLGLNVKIKYLGEKGSLTIQYKSLDQLDGVLYRLSQGVHGEKANANFSKSNSDNLSSAKKSKKKAK